MEMAAAPVELTRREREAVEAQRKKDHYMKLHAEGKTQEAQVPLLYSAWDMCYLVGRKLRASEKCRVRDPVHVGPSPAIVRCFVKKDKKG